MAQPTSGAHSGQSALNKIYGHVRDVETITAAKTLTSADIGKTLFVNYNTAATIAITLPSVVAGAHFKVYWITEMTANSAAVEIKTGGAAGTIIGVIQTMEVDGTGPLAEKDGGSATKVTIDGNPDVNIGSFIDIICDGTSWQLNGIIYTDAGGTAADCVTWDA